MSNRRPDEHTDDKEGNSAVHTSVRIGLEAAIVRPHPPKRQSFAKQDSDTSSRQPGHFL